MCTIYKHIITTFFLGRPSFFATRHFFSKKNPVIFVAGCPKTRGEWRRALDPWGGEIGRLDWSKGFQTDSWWKWNYFGTILKTMENEHVWSVLELFWIVWINFSFADCVTMKSKFTLRLYQLCHLYLWCFNLQPSPIVCWCFDSWTDVLRTPLDSWNATSCFANGSPGGRVACWQGHFELQFEVPTAGELLWISGFP